MVFRSSWRRVPFTFLFKVIFATDLSKILRVWTPQNLWTAKRGKRRRGGRKERRKGGRGERKVLGCVRDGILALCAATMEEFPCTRPPAAGYADQRRRGVRGSCSCSAEHRLQRERNGREQPALRSRAGGLRCAAALTVSRDERFELAAGLDCTSFPLSCSRPSCRRIRRVFDPAVNSLRLF